jgi:hemoglobin-like flavoprotein
MAPSEQVSAGHGAAVEASLMLAAERGGDLTAAVYDRLFARHPAMQAEFWRDRNGAIRGEMLARVFDAILDFCGPAAWAPAYLETEAVTHDAYGIPRTVFADFFAVIADTVQDTLGPDWTPAMAAGWTWLDTVGRAAAAPAVEDNDARIAVLLAERAEAVSKPVTPSPAA